MASTDPGTEGPLAIVGQTSNGSGGTAPGNPLPSVLSSGFSSFFAGSSPIFVRIGVGAAGVGLMITGLIVMGLSSRAASAVANDLVGGSSGTVVGTVAKAAV